MSYIYIVQRGNQILSAHTQKAGIKRWHNNQPKDMPTNDVTILRIGEWNDTRMVFTLDDYLANPNKQHRN